MVKSWGRMGGERLSLKADCTESCQKSLCKDCSEGQASQPSTALRGLDCGDLKVAHAPQLFSAFCLSAWTLVEPQARDLRQEVHLQMHFSLVCSPVSRNL